MEEAVDIEMPSPKRMRLEAPNQPDTIGLREAMDDFNDIYGTPTKTEEEASGGGPLTASSKADTMLFTSHPGLSLPGLPGLGLLQDEVDASDGIAKSQGQNSPKAPEEYVPAAEVICEETSSAKPPEEQPNCQERQPINMNGLEDTTEKPIEEFINSVVVEKVTGTGVQYESEEPTRSPPHAPPISTSSSPNRVEAAFEDPRALLETFLPPRSSQKSTKAETQDVDVREETKDMIDAPSFEHLATANKQNTDAEFELDSSPLNSSSDSSDDTSSSDDSDADDYEMLDPEEQARRLMAEDGGSDDERGGAAAKDKGSGPMRTQNEKPDEDVPKPNVIVTAEMKIEELGSVEGIVENVALVKAKTSGEYQVLEQGSVLCLEDRSVVGVVAETLGRVQQPYYSVRFTNAAAIAEAGIAKDIKIFYVEQYATSVFTQPLRAFKGSDASNLHDEEVGDDELEFSDDEAEAEHKRRVKLQRQQKRMGREGQNDGFSRGLGGGRGTFSRGGARRSTNSYLESTVIHEVQEQTPKPVEAALNYDDIANDPSNDREDLYTPLTRPTNLHEIMESRNALAENLGPQKGGDKSSHGRGRGRGHRGAGHGFGNGRGQGREDFGNRGIHDNRYQPSNFPQPSPQGNGFAAQALAQQYPSTPYTMAMPTQQQPHPSVQPQYPPQWTQQAAFQYPLQQYNNDPYQNQPTLQSHAQPHLTPNLATNASNGIPAGAHINPAFFRQQQQPQQQQQRWPHGS